MARFGCRKRVAAAAVAAAAALSLAKVGSIAGGSIAGDATFLPTMILDAPHPCDKQCASVLRELSATCQ